jgi:uncharacterized membrane protein YqjE
LTPNGNHDADRDARAAASDRQTDSPGAPATPQPSWRASLQDLVHALPGLISDRVELLSLELQRAGQVLAQVVALIVAAAILAVTAWLALWGGVMVALINAGLHWAAASLIVLVINLGACWWAVARVRALAPLLHLPATRRHLTLSRPSTASKPPSPDEPTEPTEPTAHFAAASARAR